MSALALCVNQNFPSFFCVVDTLLCQVKDWDVTTGRVVTSVDTASLVMAVVSNPAGGCGGFVSLL